MQGYWGDEEATRATIVDGWLHTGDIGLLDEDGYIRITDRKKDIIVNSGGDNISPQRVEGFLTLQPEIIQAMAYGDRRPIWWPCWCRSRGRRRLGRGAWQADRPDQPGGRCRVPPLHQRGHRPGQPQPVPTEKVRRFVLIAEPFTVDNEMSTPTLKIRRHVIVAHYGAALDALYDERKG